MWSNMEVIQVGNVMPTKKRKNPNQGRVYSIEGIAPCLNGMTGGGRQPYIVVKDERKKNQSEKCD